MLFVFGIFMIDLQVPVVSRREGRRTEATDPFSS